MPRKYDVVVAGHLCLDLIPTFSGQRNLADLLVPGKLNRVEALAMSTGGPVSNAGIALHKLGLRVRLMAKVGNDFLGRATRDFLATYGLEAGVEPVEGRISSYTVALAPPGTDRIFFHCSGANDDFTADDVDLDVVAEARLFHLGYPPLMRRSFEDGGVALADLFKQIQARGTVTSLDMSLPDPDGPAGRVDWVKFLERLLPHVDIFVPNVGELMFALDRDGFNRRETSRRERDLVDVVDVSEVARLGEKAIRLGAKAACVKCGHRGAYLRTSSAAASLGETWADRELWQAAFAAETIATATGAGDSAAAGFLAAYLRGLTAEKALRTACLVGWQNIQAMDAVSGVRSWEETEKQLASGPPLIDPRIEAKGWSLDETAHLFRGPHDSRR